MHGLIRTIFCALALTFAVNVSVAYAQYSSPNYKVEEHMFGTGGDLDSSSANYKAQSSVGSLGVGFGSSANYRSGSGFLTQDQVFLAMEVTGDTVDLGVLSSGSTSSGADRGTLTNFETAGQPGAANRNCQCSFAVRSYISSAYGVYTMSNPPTNESGYSLTAKSVQAAPSGTQGVEEFGINLVANTSPSTMGANSFNYPDNTFADGVVAAAYGTTNQFKYGVGDLIAFSPGTAGNQGVGQTEYTISYIAKSKPTTPAGYYVMSHDLVAVSTF